MREPPLSASPVVLWGVAATYAASIRAAARARGLQVLSTAATKSAPLPASASLVVVDLGSPGGPVAEVVHDIRAGLPEAPLVALVRAAATELSV